MNSYFKQYLSGLVPEENITEHERMASHTTFRVGGEAEVFIKIQNSAQLSRIVRYLRNAEVPYYIIGNGSNLLVSDRGIDGVVLQIAGEMNDLTINGNQIRVKAGCMLNTVARSAANAGLTGMEFASGIPGTVGGAVVMNAGAYDGEMKQIVKSVTVMNEEGEFLTLDNESMEFGYRSSVIRNRPFVVIEAVLELQFGDPKRIQERMTELAAKRREKQPLEYPSAGSTFKRPEGYYAGKLIMEAGMKGYRIGNAQVSEKHCGFIVNLGNAQAADINDLIEEVRERVKDRFGVILEPEVVRIGDFG